MDQPNYFLGDSMILDGVNRSSSYELEHINIEDLLARNSPSKVYFHVGRFQDIDLNRSLFELILLLLNRHAVNNEIVLVSFFLQSYCIDKDELFGCFNFIHLPSIDENESEPRFGADKIDEFLLESTKRNVIQSRMKHDSGNGKLPTNIQYIIEKLLLRTKEKERIEIVVLDDDAHEDIKLNIEKGIKFLNFERFYGLDVVVTGFDQAYKMLDYLEDNRWRYVKVMLIDFELRNPKNRAEPQSISGVNLIKEINKCNSSIDIWGMSVHNPSSAINLENKSFQQFIYHEDVEDVIDKNELLGTNVTDEIRRFLIEPLKEKVETPFFNEFKNYVAKATKSWHVPGHNRGKALANSKFGEEFYNFFGRTTFASDHDVPKELGSIFSNQNVNNIIGRTQKKVAETFNVRKTYFVTNGNSAANNIILLSLLKPNDRVLVARSCHKSIHYAMVLSGANPTYLNSKFCEKYEIMAPPSIGEIEEKLKKDKENPYKLVIVTGCSYEGLVMDIKRLNDLCKEYETELFVDEAWFGYSNFHHQYQERSATRIGVPYVTQSAHKMLSAFRQSAFIHINKNVMKDDFEDFFKDIYNTFTSTSPQYQLIASMDVAAMQMRIEGHELVDKALERAKQFEKEFKNLELKKIILLEEEHLKSEFKDYDFEEENIFLDPLKKSFDISKTGIDVKDAFNFIKKEAGVDLIKYTKNCIQILFTIGTASDRNKPTTLVKALKKLEQEAEFLSRKKSEDEKKDLEKESGDKKDNFSGLNLGKEYTDKLPRDYFYGKRKLLTIEEAVEQKSKSATLVTPYPPGIPILLPGEEITREHIQYINQILTLGHVSIHGLKDGKIFVCDG